MNDPALSQIDLSGYLQAALRTLQHGHAHKLDAMDLHAGVQGLVPYIKASVDAIKDAPQYARLMADVIQALNEQCIQLHDQAKVARNPSTDAQIQTPRGVDADPDSSIRAEPSNHASEGASDPAEPPLD